MSAIVHQEAVPANFEDGFVYLNTTPGRLKSLTAFGLLEPVESTDLWIEIGIVTGSHDRINRTAVLASGYAGGNSSVFWTGDILLGEDDSVYAFALSWYVDTVRLCAKVEHPKSEVV
jgi:hypothetical protein